MVVALSLAISAPLICGFSWDLAYGFGFGGFGGFGGLAAGSLVCMNASHLTVENRLTDVISQDKQLVNWLEKKKTHVGRLRVGCVRRPIGSHV